MSIVVETWMAQDLDLGNSTTSKTHPGGGTLNGHQICLSTLSTSGASGDPETASWDTGSIAAGSYATKEVTVQGAALGDFAMASLSLDVQDMQLNANVTAANTVTVTLFNPTGSAIDIGTPTLKVLVFKTR